MIERLGSTDNRTMQEFEKKIILDGNDSDVILNLVVGSILKYTVLLQLGFPARSSIFQKTEWVGKFGK